MKRIRIGNDFTFSWTITRVGQSESFNTTDVEVYLQHLNGNKINIDFEIDDNVVTGVFRGKDQRNVGIYNIITVFNNGKVSMNTVDIPNAFELVSSTSLEGGSDTDDLETETASFSTNIQVPSNGIGIKTITTTTSSADEGVNTVTITLDSGSTYTFQIKNGSKGSPGAKGDKGDTPVITSQKVDNENNIIVDGVVVATILDGVANVTKLKNTFYKIENILSSLDSNNEQTDALNGLHELIANIV